MSIESAESTVALAERLAASLRFARITVDQMADRLGITPATIDSWLHGLSSPRLSLLMVWAQIVRVPFEWLTGTEDDPAA